MSKFMTIAGIILAAVAVALGLMIFFSPSSVVGWGITPQAAIELLVGGILAIGLGGVIDAAGHIGAAVPAAVSVAAPAAEDLPQFGRRAEPAPASAVAAAVEEGLSPATSQTIRAIEEAKSEISKAFGDGAPETRDIVPAAVAESPAATVTATEAIAEEAAAPAEEEAEASAEDEDGQLYVIEEKLMRGRPARLLSDGTIEAETDEGWMRFENLDHLNEYLDAMAPGS